MFPPFSRPPNKQAGELGVFIFEEQDESVSAFGEQWSRHARTQLDSHTGVSISETRLRRMFGETASNLDGKIVLEAGCGSGRFTEILLKFNCFVCSFDLSVAVHFNHLNNGGNPRLQLLQCSITDIPYPDESFDYIFCPGVLQHTPEPNLAMASLYSKLKPGGWLIFDQYRYNLSSFLRTAWILRLFLRRLSPGLGFKVTNKLVQMFLPLHKRFAKFRVLEILLFRVSPITSHFSGYPELPEESQLAWAQLNTHDNLTDFYKRQTTLKALKKKVNKLGAINQTYRVMPYTIEVKCQKPGIDIDLGETVLKVVKSKIVSG